MLCNLKWNETLSNYAKISHSTYMLCLVFFKRHFFLCLLHVARYLFLVALVAGWHFYKNPSPKGFQLPAIPTSNPEKTRDCREVQGFERTLLSSSLSDRFVATREKERPTIRHEKFQVPKMEVLNLIRPFWGWVCHK